MVWHWDGTSWQGKSLYFYLSLGGVHGTGPKDVWVVGNRTTVPNTPALWHFDGTDWTETDVALRLPYESLSKFSDVFARSARDVWVTGTGARGGLLHYDGTDWRWEPAGVGNRMNGLWGTGTALYAVGEQGAVLQR